MFPTPTGALQGLAQLAPLSASARVLRPGAWLASLEFDVPGLAATKVLECADGRRLWLYRVPFRPRR
jgi:hypothetical protein